MGFNPFLGQPFCRFDISGLATLVATAQQHDYRAAAKLEVDAVTRTVVNPRLAHPFADGNGIAEETLG
jgi:hypothetical protein